MTEGIGKSFYWDYSENSDILHVHQNGAKTKGSAEISDFTLDFDIRGRVVGIEVSNAGEFFSSLGIPKLKLPQIQDAEIIVKTKNNVIIVLMKVLFPQNKEYIIPLPVPVVC